MSTRGVVLPNALTGAYMVKKVTGRTFRGCSVS